VLTALVVSALVILTFCGNMIRYRKCTRALRDGHFDFGRDRDEMDPKPWFWDGIGRDGIFSGLFRDFSGFFWDHKILFSSFNFGAFIHYDV
jgi:hypothetical protein